MKIVRSFGAVCPDFIEIENLQIRQTYRSRIETTYYCVKNLDLQYGSILLPPIRPTLVSRYFGLQLHQPQGIEIAVCRPGNPRQYYEFDGGRWESVSTPVFQSPVLLRLGMSQWIGAIQFHLRLDASATFIDFFFRL